MARITVRQLIIDYLSKNPFPNSLKELAEKIGRKYGSVTSALSRGKKAEQFSYDPKTRRYSILFVRKYASTLMYCTSGSAKHSQKHFVLAYTFEANDKDRSTDLLEAIHQKFRNCYPLDYDDLSFYNLGRAHFKEGFGYGQEIAYTIEERYIYPEINVLEY